MSASVRVLLAIGIVGYPLAVYLLHARVHPAVLIGIFGALAVARVSAIRQLQRRHRLIGLMGVGAFCAAAWIGSQLDVLKLYPVLVSVAGAGYGAWTLVHPPSAIERVARVAEPHERFDARKVVYTRRVTWLWVCFLTANAGVAAYSAVAASTAFWSLYNGLVSYLLIGALFGGEYLFRGWYRRRHYVDDEPRDRTLPKP